MSEEREVNMVHKYSSRRQPYPAAIQNGRVESSSLPPTQNHNDELLRIKAHWLVDLFPDELVIQEKTVSIIRNEFLFLASFVETMPIKDIGRVVYVDTPIFAGLEIIGKNTQHRLYIKGLRRSQAIRAKEIIEGLLLEDSGAIELAHWVQNEDRRHQLALAGRNPEKQHSLDIRARLRS